MAIETIKEQSIKVENTFTDLPPDSPSNGHKQDDAGDDDSAYKKGELERLKDLLVDSNRIGEALPSAIEASAKQGDRLSRATLPLTEGNIRESIARNPKILADALFPALGPAIRKAISNALSSMVQSFNQTLEHSISPRGLRWRFEALRTGKSFGEIVMLKTLLYRVEQVFLIHKSSGLLLQHAVGDKSDLKDADMVSGMLTAINDFVHDSFKTSAGATLDSLMVNDLSVWIEHSSDLLIAAVIRGRPPFILRTLLTETIEEIQMRYQVEIAAFDGHSEVFDTTRPVLKKCLMYQTNEADGEPKPFFSRPLKLFLAAVGVCVLGALAYLAWDYRRLSDYVNRLESEPGIIVMDSNFGLFSHSVHGMRDPLASDPEKIRNDVGFDENDISENWHFYSDGNPTFVLIRAEKLLKPPEGVNLTLENGVLKATGTAPPNWIRASEKLALAIPGITATQFGGDSIETVRARIESSTIQFQCNTDEWVEDQENRLYMVNADIQQLLTADESFELEVLGHSSSSGEGDINFRLRKARAENVKAFLSSRLEQSGNPLQGNTSRIIVRTENDSGGKDECAVTFRVISKEK